MSACRRASQRPARAHEVDLDNAVALPNRLQDVTPATLVVGAIGSNKPYDATTAATVVLTDDRLAGDPLGPSSNPTRARSGLPGP